MSETPNQHAELVRGTIVQAITERATREGLWEMQLQDIDIHTLAEGIIEALERTDD